jgi:8-amino-3,8-dideoxy-alpha-D-manno-octulosonate transaminase
MRGSNRRIREKIQITPGVKLRRLNDPSGDAGAFVIFMLETEAQALRVVRDLKAAGLLNVFRIADYGLHIYYNFPSLVKKVPLSPAGNPWSLEANRQSIQTYDRGSCPASDALFARSVLLPVPSRLTSEQETLAARIVQQAVGAASG